MDFSKGKFPVVPFYEITSPYSYFEDIWIFGSIYQGYSVFLDHILLRINWNEKFVYNSSNVLPFYTSSQNSKVNSLKPSYSEPPLHVLVCTQNWHLNIKSMYCATVKQLEISSMCSSGKFYALCFYQVWSKYVIQYTLDLRKILGVNQIFL